MINYFTTTVIHLSLEPYYNEGMTSGEAKEIIESIPDPFSPGGFKIKCIPQYINGNWNVETWAAGADQICEIVELIEWTLDRKIKEKD